VDDHRLTVVDVHRCSQEMRGKIVAGWNRDL